jgi:hypothetical protein
MTKKDFMTLEEYKKSLETPKKEEFKLIELKPKADKEKAEDESMAMDDAYEAYKLEWMIEQGYTVYDLIEAVVDFANTNNKIKELREDPTGIVSKWEDKAGFGVAMWDDYDTWLDSMEDDEVVDSGDLDKLTEIVDLLDNGYTADEIESLGYSPEDVEIAIQYSNFTPAR